MSGDLVSSMSDGAADAVFGSAAVPDEVALEVGDLARIERHTDSLTARDFDDCTWDELLAEVDRTKRAMANYPKTPTLPALRIDDVACPKWSDL